MNLFYFLSFFIVICTVILASLQEFMRIATKWKLVITDLSPDFKTGQTLVCFNTKERDPVFKDL
jgi:hypothetical protein